MLYCMFYCMFYFTCDRPLKAVANLPSSSNTQTKWTVILASRLSWSQLAQPSEFITRCCHLSNVYELMYITETILASSSSLALVPVQVHALCPVLSTGPSTGGKGEVFAGPASVKNAESVLNGFFLTPNMH